VAYCKAESGKKASGRAAFGFPLYSYILVATFLRERKITLATSFLGSNGPIDSRQDDDSSPGRANRDRHD